MAAKRVKLTGDMIVEIIAYLSQPINYAGIGGREGNTVAPQRIFRPSLGNGGVGDAPLTVHYNV